jgi:hypothetical protein
VNKRVWPALVLAFVIFAVLPASAWATPTSHALDYLHAKQVKTGGFGVGTSADAQMTPWVVMAIAAAGESPQSARWTRDGNNPLHYLQSIDLQSAAGSASTQVNVPAFYAKVILAYVAANRTDLVGSAGAKGINLITELEKYQDNAPTLSGSSDPNPNYGAFSPWGGSSTNPYAKINTTIWAVLALRAAGETNGRLSAAVDWLAAHQGTSGGFGSQAGALPDVDDTAAAIMALRAGGLSADNAVVIQAVAYLRTQQNPDGGFPDRHGDSSYAESTSWAIQALIAAGENPATWTKGSATPITFLKKLQRRSGLFEHRDGLVANPLMTTTEATIALSGRPFPLVEMPFHASLAFRPVFDSFTPTGGPIYKTSTVTVKAAYHDTPKHAGTGINTEAVRVWLDTVNVTRHVKILSGSLSLTITKLSNAKHTVEIKLADRAGNTRTASRSFTIAVPAPTPTTGTGGSGIGGAANHGSGSSGAGTTGKGSTTTGGTTLYPQGGGTGTTSPSPGATAAAGDGTVTGSVLDASGISPTPSPGVSTTTGQPLPTPTANVTGQVTKPGGEGGGGIPVEGYIGGGLVALLPIGALASHLFQKREMAALAEAGYGHTLVRGRSPLLRATRGLLGLTRSLPFVRK